MGRLTIKYASPLGAYDQKYGQKYYGKAHDTDMDISFNLMNPVNFEDGDEIEFEEKIIKEKGPESKNPGEEYIFLKKVKRYDSGSARVEGQPSSPEPTQATQKPATAIPPKSDLSYEAGTNARWALKLAVDTYKSVVGGMPDSAQDYNQILKFAKWLITSFEDLKTGRGRAEPEAPVSGVDKARATAEAIKRKSNGNGVEDVTGQEGFEDPFAGGDSDE